MTMTLTKDEAATISMFCLLCYTLAAGLLVATGLVVVRIYVLVMMMFGLAAALWVLLETKSVWSCAFGVLLVGFSVYLPMLIFEGKYAGRNAVLALLSCAVIYRALCDGSRKAVRGALLAMILAILCSSAYTFVYLLLLVCYMFSPYGGNIVPMLRSSVRVLRIILLPVVLTSGILIISLDPVTLIPPCWILCLAAYRWLGGRFSRKRVGDK